jgi:phosphoglycolate phosphatase
LLIGHIVEVEQIDPRRTIMVGDRANDMLAASRHRVPAIGALWGYGDATELTEAGAVVLCASPNHLVGTVQDLIKV